MKGNFLKLALLAGVVTCMNSGNAGMHVEFVPYGQGRQLNVYSIERTTTPVSQMVDIDQISDAISFAERDALKVYNADLKLANTSTQYVHALSYRMEHGLRSTTNPQQLSDSISEVIARQQEAQGIYEAQAEHDGKPYWLLRNGAPFASVFLAGKTALGYK